MTRLSHRIWQIGAMVTLLGFVSISCKTTQQTRTPIAKPPVADVPKPAAQPSLPVLPDTPAKPVLPMIQQPLIDPSRASSHVPRRASFVARKA